MVELGAPRIALEIAAETRKCFTMLKRASGRKSGFVLQGLERPGAIPIGVEDLLHVVTHRFRLEQIEQAYDLFSHQRDGVLKVAITP